MEINRKPPKRLAVIIALQALLEGICRVDGYAFDLAGKVVRNRALIGADIMDKPPLVGIIEAPRPDFALFAGENNSHRKDNWTLLIQGIVKDDKTANMADDAFYLCQDVERRLSLIGAIKQGGNGKPLFPEYYMLGGMIAGIEIAPPVIRPPEAQVSAHAFFYLPIRLGIAGELGE